mgnify:FL=1
MWSGLFFAFTLALTTFYINHRLQKMLKIKITINSLFDIYGNENSIDNFDHNEANKSLQQEILILEKLNDNNYFITQEINKLKQLRKLYYELAHTREHMVKVNKAWFKNNVEKIQFKKLTKSFIVLSFLDLN